MTPDKEWQRLYAEAWEKWIQFSEAQSANELIVNKENMQRFYVWLQTGDDDDAWS